MKARRDCGPRRLENSLHHPDYRLDSGDYGLRDREDLPDRIDHFPGHREDCLKLCDYCLRFPD